MHHSGKAARSKTHRRGALLYAVTTQGRHSVTSIRANAGGLGTLPTGGRLPGESKGQSLVTTRDALHPDASEAAACEQFQNRVIEQLQASKSLRSEYRRCY